MTSEYLIAIVGIPTRGLVIDSPIPGPKDTLRIGGFHEATERRTQSDYPAPIRVTH